MSKNSEVPNVARWLEADNPAPVVGFLLRCLHLGLRQAMDEALRRQGVELSFAHFAALFGLHFEPGITGAQLARRAVVSAQTMNAALRRLEQEGLVVRRPHPESRRADSWQVTPEGERQLERARKVGNEVFSRMLSGLSPEEVEQLQSYLRRCIAALGTGERFLEPDDAWEEDEAQALRERSASLHA
ncbi:MAG TPA: MarR family transcriptional regulator [Gammaproteobacteria bacterium]